MREPIFLLCQHLLAAKPPPLLPYPNEKSPYPAPTQPSFPPQKITNTPETNTLSPISSRAQPSPPRPLSSRRHPAPAKAGGGDPSSSPLCQHLLAAKPSPPFHPAHSKAPHARCPRECGDPSPPTYTFHFEHSVVPPTCHSERSAAKSKNLAASEPPFLF